MMLPPNLPRIFFLLAFLGTGPATGLYGQSADLLYPPTPVKEAQTYSYHGTIIKDLYYWLEEMESAETRMWVDNQEAFLEEFLQGMPQEAYIRDRLTQLTEYDLYTVPEKREDAYFYLKVPSGEDRASLLVQNGTDGTPEVLIDPEVFPQTQTNIPHLGNPGFYVNHSGSGIAVLLAEGPSRWFSAQIFDPVTKQFSGDVIEGMYHTSQKIAWDRDDRGFYYVKYDRTGGESNLNASPVSPKVYYHTSGTGQEEDSLIYASVDSAEILTLEWSREMKYLIIHSRIGSSRANKVLVLDLDKEHGEPEILFEDEPAYFQYLGNRQSRFWFYTDLRAPNGRVISVDLSDVSVIQETVKESDEPISGSSLVGGNALGLFGETFVIMYTSDGLPFIRGYSLDGTLKYKRNLPIDGSVWGGFFGTQNQDEFYYQFLGFTEPSIIYRVSAGTGDQEVLHQAEIDFESDQYVTRQIFYSSRDGTRIPMFVTHKKGIVLDGNNPAFMYAYGAFGWNSFLWYQPHLLIWLEHGGIYAQPGIRGGGEYGKEWQEAGVGLNRQNAVDDYIGAAEWLVEEKYSSPDKLVLNGGSASGPLAGAVMMQRPDLFGAVVIDRPALDMIRYSEFTVAKTWIQEFGSPENEEEFQVLYRLSPYHNIKPHTCYPPTLVMAGEKDEVTPPFHAYKFIAKLQNRPTTCSEPALLKIMRNTGHTFGSTPELTVDSRAAELLFLFKTLRLRE